MLLALAGFASQAQVRVTDSLLPQIAADFATTVGAASIVVTAYVVTHGSIQLVIGPVGDRFGKYLTVTLIARWRRRSWCCCAGSPDRCRSSRWPGCSPAPCAGWVIPLSMAYVGDVTPYERRQPVLGALSLRADFRTAVRPGGRRRARRPVRLAQRVLRAGRHVRAGRPSG